MKDKASWCAYLSSGWGVLMGLTVQEFALWVGIITGLGTFLVNWYYKAKEDARRDAAITKG